MEACSRCKSAQEPRLDIDLDINVIVFTVHTRITCMARHRVLTKNQCSAASEESLAVAAGKNAAESLSCFG